MLGIDDKQPKQKEYKKIHPEFNLSRYIESQLLFTKTFTPIKFTS